MIPGISIYIHNSRFFATTTTRPPDPVVPLGPASQLVPVFVSCLEAARSHLLTLPSSSVLSQCLDVQAHLSFISQHQLLQSGLHGPHQCLGLLTPQTLGADPQIRTLDTGENWAQVTNSNIHDLTSHWRPVRPSARRGQRQGPHPPATSCPQSRVSHGAPGQQQR